MPNYRRNYVPGGTYFFTVVTYERRPILTAALGRTYLRQALEQVQAERPFAIDAMVLLPDHLHCLWTLPTADHRYSLRWAKIKEAFTRAYVGAGGREGRQTASRVRHRERAIWQRRFWEHTIRDEEDLKLHLDYIHWNPVKHQLVAMPKDYPWSTFRRYVRLGEYPLEWGGENPCQGYNDPEWE